MIRRLQDWLAGQASVRPDARAIVFHNESITYQQLEESSNRLARALKEAGCVRGDRVALLLPKSPKALIGMFASLKADCMYVPIDTSSPAARTARILESCARRCVLADRSTDGLLRQLSSALSPDTRTGWMDAGREPGYSFS